LISRSPVLSAFSKPQRLSLAQLFCSSCLIGCHPGYLQSGDPFFVSGPIEAASFPFKLLRNSPGFQVTARNLRTSINETGSLFDDMELSWGFHKMRHRETNHKDLGTRTKRLWLSFLNRHVMQSGGFKRLIDRNEVTGIVADAETFASSVCGGREYRSRIRLLARSGMDAEEIYKSIAVEDAKYAADLLLPVFQRTHGRDGLVGVTVSPEFAYDVEALLEEGRELWEKASRPNIMIQIPSTTEAVPAIRTLLQGGINVNATMLYSFSRYREVALAYIAAMTERSKKGDSLEGIVSAATFSGYPPLRAKAEQKPEGGAMARLQDISGSTARFSLQLHSSLFQKGIFLDLAARGARPQLLMWLDETDSMQPGEGGGCAVELSEKYFECEVNPASLSEEERDNFDRLLDLLQEETIKRQVIEIDIALNAMQRQPSSRFNHE
jgi:hypothetical protein